MLLPARDSGGEDTFVGGESMRPLECNSPPLPPGPPLPPLAHGAIPWTGVEVPEPAREELWERTAFLCAASAAALAFIGSAGKAPVELLVRGVQGLLLPLAPDADPDDELASFEAAEIG